MKAEPTPAPWRLVEAHPEEDGSVYPPHIVGGARELQICSFFEFGDDRICESETDVRSKRANAHLIAAAPELSAAAHFAKAALEALEGYEADYGEPLDDMHELGRIEDSRATPSFRIRVGHIRALAAAIAKAEGRS